MHFCFVVIETAKMGTYRMAKLFLLSVSSTSSSFYVYKGPCSKCSLITWCVYVWRWWWWCVCIARTQTISIFLAFIFPSDIFHCSHWHRYAIVLVCISTHRERQRERRICLCISHHSQVIHRISYENTYLMSRKKQNNYYAIIYVFNAKINKHSSCSVSAQISKTSIS